MDPLVQIQRPPLNDLHFQSALLAFGQEPSVEHAAEVVGGAIVLGREKESQAAAAFLLSSKQASTTNRNLASKTLGLGLIEKDAPGDAFPQWVYQKISSIKAMLVNYPNNPLLWVELGRHYLLLGQLEPSNRAIETAVALAPAQRFVLRSAARFFIHKKEPDRALAILERNQIFQRDPWLMAAQIAISQVAGRTSLHVKKAEKMSGSSQFSPLQVSELSSALGSLELSQGNSRFARRYFRQSLMDPTENALAQAIWSQQHLSHLEVPLERLHQQGTFEANARQAYAEHRWRDTLEACASWLTDEPFSSRPAVLGSFVSAVTMEDFGRSELFCRMGLRANPHHPLLNNNLAVALACQGKVEEAQSVFGSIPSNPKETDQAPAITATLGLLAYRSGRVEEGRKLYRQAIELAGNDKRLRAMAVVHYGMEELRVVSPPSEELLRVAESACEGSIDPAINILLERLRARFAKALEDSRKGKGT